MITEAPSIQHLPTATVWAANFLLACGEDQVMAMIEDGRLDPAWDISAGAGERRAVRIYGPALLSFARLGRAVPVDYDAAVDHVLPTRSTMSTVEVSQSLSCSNLHVFDLGKAGLIRQIGECRPGPGGSAQWARESLVRFLENRRLP